VRRSAGLPVAFVILVGALLLGSCGKHKPVVSRAAQAEIWERYIAGYTSGLVSRESTIMVRLTTDAVGDDSINQTITPSPFTFRPAIKGTAAWVDRRTIEFRPEQDLKGGTRYEVGFVVSRFVQVPKERNRFEFTFSTIEQNLDVRVEGLQAMRAEDLKWQQLQGSVTTADFDDASLVEKSVEARQGNRKLSMRWDHATDRLGHRFTIDSIERGDKASQLRIAWSGKPIGVDKQGEEKVQVPAIGDFSVIEAVVVQGAEQHIVVRFSDPLEQNQDLAGLIQLGEDQEPRFTIDRNEVHAYPTKPLKASLTVHINPGIRNIAGSRFSQTVNYDLTVESIKPEVRFSGNGVIIPSTPGLSIPFEAVNVGAVEVRAIRIFESNIPQFLQVNDLSGEQELRRVGRVVWRQTVDLNVTPAMQNRWIRCAFDPAPLLAGGGNALYRIEMSFQRRHSLYPCDNVDTSSRISRPMRTRADEDEEEPEGSFWDTYEYGDYDEAYGEYNKAWENRMNPCHPGYYRDYWDHKITVARNFLVSDIGLTAKRCAGDTLYVTATDLKTADPLTQLDLQVRGYQHQIVGTGKTGDDGMAVIPVATKNGKPYLLVADNGKQKGYLKLDDGNSLPVSHFDVGGAAIPRGIKGFLYGERGVWRPGDSLFLTFVMQDETGRIPEDHPVTMELINPRGQLLQTITRTESVRRFYSFSTSTNPDAPTGTYTARVHVGGASFDFPLKIETVMPNRLKVRLSFGKDTLVVGKIKGELTARWLHGATARNLKADVEVRLQSTPTSFRRYVDYVFDDPVRKYDPETQTLFEGSLNADGVAKVEGSISAKGDAPGLLRANFRSRVFEEGGAFSVDRMSTIYSPYQRYIGILTPKGDRIRGMLLTDTTHTVRVVSVSPSGAPVSARRIQCVVYKIDWRWWWDRGEESLADYITSQHHTPVAADTISTGANGEGTFSFTVAYPEWGRFLIRAVDLDGGHATGKTVYIDWPGWAGRSQKEVPGGATVLAFSSDKSEYAVGENASLTIPSNGRGRIFISIENGSTVLKRYWINALDNQTVHSLPLSAEMAPSVYIYAAYLQPYGQTANDLPIRMYGVIPLRVVNPATKLKPLIDAPDVLTPESRAVISVREESGREMAYTLALVDEGLLDLTRFETPDLWDFFYQREALGVKTWDLYDLVCGAFGAKLERLLAIGGDDNGVRPGQKRGNRFPPMVRCYGPFQLRKGEVDKREIDIPNYVGSVRVMVVAGQNRAYGSAEKTVPVRKPLMVLGTLPRVLGPQETVALPISVFALENRIREAKIAVRISGDAAIEGESSKLVRFKEPGDELAIFTLKAGQQAGPVRVTIEAASGGDKATQEIDIAIRNPNRAVVDVVDTVLDAGGAWSRPFTLPGVPGTNSALLDLSTIAPLNLGKRLDFLIAYPYGCVEQTTSSVFPQLYLDKVVDLSPARKAEIQNNVKTGIDRLKSFQNSRGGFSYWPDGGDADPWASNYAGHFLMEAKLTGYAIPAGMIDRWIKNQKNAAVSWSGTAAQTQLIQAYRLFTLALAQAPEMGAMNRLRESGRLPEAAQWRLAAAYQLAGHPETAKELINNLPLTVKPYRELYWTYGSDVRDNAMILETLVMLGDMTSAAKVAKSVSGELCRDGWMSTQSTAYALLAMAKFAQKAPAADKIETACAVNGGKETILMSSSRMMQFPLDISAKADEGNIDIRNKAKGFVFARLMLKGIPAIGQESGASEGLELSVSYRAKDGSEMNPSALAQGTDFVAQVEVSPQNGLGPYQQVALAQLFPSGWEIRNARFEGIETGSSAFTYQDIRDDRVYTFFDVPSSQTLKFRVMLNASYLGTFYLPSTSVEAMYDASINARVPGKWIKVIEPGE